VNHLHLKLYPLHGIEKEWQEVLSQESKYFEEYQGYVSTQMGEQADMEEL
jgi:hypothetical protein